MRSAWHQPYACQVVKSRASRMGLADMVRGLAILAQRLYPELGTQAAAFHRRSCEEKCANSRGVAADELALLASLPRCSAEMRSSFEAHGQA